MTLFETSPVFEWNLNCKKDIVVNQGGTSSGKTYSILQVLIVLSLIKPKQVTTVVGQDLPNLKAGALRDMENIVFGSEEVKQFLGHYNKSNFTFTFKNGSIIEFKSYQNAQDAKSGKRDYSFFNEANGISLEVYQEIEIRTRKQVFIDYNPTAPFWVHSKLIGEPNIQLFISTYKHNPFLDAKTIEKIERYKYTNPERWRVYGLGLTGMVEGVIFQNINKVSGFPLKQAKKVTISIDFGFSNDPTAIIMVGVYQGEIYVHELVYQRGLTNQDISDLLHKFNFDQNQYEIIADSAEPKSIEELKRLGWFVIPSQKGRDSILYGIDLLKNYKINVSVQSKNLLMELSRYVWVKKDGENLNKPIDRYNHAIDALRYAVSYQLQNPNLGEYHIY